MISDPTKLRELVEELAELSLESRRKYLADLERTDGEAAAEQIKDCLKRLWEER